MYEKKKRLVNSVFSILQDMFESKLLSLNAFSLDNANILLSGEGPILPTETQMTLYKRPFENTFGKGENAGHEHFLRFLHCFVLSKTKFFSHTYIVISKYFEFESV